jgi:hypothetical protein
VARHGGLAWLRTRDGLGSPVVVHGGSAGHALTDWRDGQKGRQQVGDEMRGILMGSMDSIDQTLLPHVGATPQFSLTATPHLGGRPRTPR